MEETSFKQPSTFRTVLWSRPLGSKQGEARLEAQEGQCSVATENLVIERRKEEEDQKERQREPNKFRGTTLEPPTTQEKEGCRETT